MCTVRVRIVPYMIVLLFVHTCEYYSKHDFIYKLFKYIQKKVVHIFNTCNQCAKFEGRLAQKGILQTYQTERQAEKAVPKPAYFVIDLINLLLVPLYMFYLLSF
jgi:hypothetical protein